MDRILRRAGGLATILAATLACPRRGSAAEPGKNVNCGTVDKPRYMSSSGPSRADMPPLSTEPYAQFMDMTAEGAERPCTWPYTVMGNRELARTLWSSYASAFGTKDWDNTAPSSPYRRIVLDWEGRRIVLKSRHPFIKRDPGEDPVLRRKRKAFDAIVSVLERHRGPTIVFGGPETAKKTDFNDLSRMTIEQLRKTADEPSDAWVRESAMQQIIGKRERARPYLPWLAVRLSSSSPYGFKDALARIGPPGEEERPALARLLTHGDSFVRQRASSALAAMGSAGARSSGELRRVIGRTAGVERREHARSLAVVTSGSPETFVFLRKLIRAAPPAERYDLINLLLIFDKREETARELFKVAHGYERMQLAEHLLRLDTRDEDVREFFKSSRGKERTAVARLLLKSGTQDEDVLEVLLEGVKGADPDAIRYFLASPAAPRAVPVLLEQLKNGTGSELGTIYALGEVGPPASDAVPVMLERLSSDRAAVRSAAAYALGRMGPGASAAESRLKGLRWDSAPTVRWHAKAALLSIRGGISGKKPWWQMW